MLQVSASLTPFKTNWRQVLALIATGVVAAFQVGKAAIALPLLRADLGLDLVAASWVVGAYGTLGALAGLPAGILVSILGPRTMLLMGLATVAAGSLLGSLAGNVALLLATRALEGFGFLAIVISIPTLLRTVTAPADRDFVFGCWGAYMATGTAIMMLAGPPIAASGWQALWLVNGLLAAAYLAVAWVILPVGSAPLLPEMNLGKNIGALLRSRGSLVIAAAFGVYTFQYFALTAFLPYLLVDRIGLTMGQAGAIGAGAVVANAVGNIAGGALMHRGLPLWAIAAVAFAVGAVAPFAMFSPAPWLVLVAAAGTLSLGITGLVPACLLAAAPRVAATSQLLAMTMGLLMQASNLGQLVGPAAVGSLVEHLGWGAAPFAFLAAGTIGILFMVVLRGRLRSA